MTTALARRSDFAETMAELFSPVDVDSLGPLLAQYRDVRARVEHVASVFGDEALSATLRYFATGNDFDAGPAMTSRLFGLDGAIKALRQADDHQLGA